LQVCCFLVLTIDESDKAVEKVCELLFPEPKQHYKTTEGPALLNPCVCCYKWRRASEVSIVHGRDSQWVMY